MEAFARKGNIYPWYILVPYILKYPSASQYSGICDIFPAISVTCLCSIYQILKTNLPGSCPGLASWTLPPASSSSYVGGSGGYRIHVHHSIDRFSRGSHHLKKSNASCSVFFNPHMFVHSTYILHILQKLWYCEC